MIAKPLYFVEAIKVDGEIVGVDTRPSPGCGFMCPTYVPREQAARLHQNEARKLRKWAIAHGMNARTRLDKSTLRPQRQTRPFAKVSKLLGSVLG